MSTIADRIIEFNKTLQFPGRLPDGINVMNPFTDDYIMHISSAFYRKYYNDTKGRHLILGINPGRFGAGVTGIPFTDTKRLTGECGIKYSGKETHEPSSVFVYEVIKAYGGPDKFYGDFYIGAVSPLGFTISDQQGREKNYNYYDSKEMTLAVNDFALSNLKKQLDFGIERDICFCFGTGKNEKYLREINNNYGFFKKIVALEHPRFIMQYKSRSREAYVTKYLEAFAGINTP
jgi:hypothetical protein